MCIEMIITGNFTLIFQFSRDLFSLDVVLKKHLNDEIDLTLRALSAIQLLFK